MNSAGIKRRAGTNCAPRSKRARLLSRVPAPLGLLYADIWEYMITRGYLKPADLVCLAVAWPPLQRERTLASLPRTRRACLGALVRENRVRQWRAVRAALAPVAPRELWLAMVYCLPATWWPNPSDFMTFWWHEYALPPLTKGTDHLAVLRALVHLGDAKRLAFFLALRPPSAYGQKSTPECSLQPGYLYTPLGYPIFLEGTQQQPDILTVLINHVVANRYDPILA